MATQRHSTEETNEGRGSQMKEQAKEMGKQAQDQVASQLDAQKDRASDQLGTVSSALRQTSSNLREEDEDMVADYVEGAARQVDRFSEYLRTHSVGDLFSEVEGYARRNPSLFLGGAVFAGFMGARFLKSTSPEHRRQEGSGWDRPRSMGRRHSYEERSFREPPQGARGYSRVHGTAGGEMPDPSRTQETPVSEERTPEMAKEHANPSSRTEEERR